MCTPAYLSCPLGIIQIIGNEITPSVIFLKWLPIVCFMGNYSLGQTNWISCWHATPWPLNKNCTSGIYSTIDNIHVHFNISNQVIKFTFALRIAAIGRRILFNVSTTRKNPSIRLPTSSTVCSLNMSQCSLVSSASFLMTDVWDGSSKNRLRQYFSDW